MNSSTVSKSSYPFARVKISKITCSPLGYTSRRVYSVCPRIDISTTLREPSTSYTPRAMSNHDTNAPDFQNHGAIQEPTKQSLPAFTITKIQNPSPLSGSTQGTSIKKLGFTKKREVIYHEKRYYSLKNCLEKKQM